MYKLIETFHAAFLLLRYRTYKSKIVETAWHAVSIFRARQLIYKYTACYVIPLVKLVCAVFVKKNKISINNTVVCAAITKCPKWHLICNLTCSSKITSQNETFLFDSPSFIIYQKYFFPVAIYDINLASN